MPFPGKGAVLIELSGQIAFGSTYFCDLVGVEHEKIAGMSCFDFVYPQDMEEAKKVFDPANASDKPSSMRLRRTDGTAVWVEIQGTALESAHGEVYALSATVTAAAKESTDPKRETRPRLRRNRKFKALLYGLTKLRSGDGAKRGRCRER